MSSLSKRRAMLIRVRTIKVAEANKRVVVQIADVVITRPVLAVLKAVVNVPVIRAIITNVKILQKTPQRRMRTKLTTNHKTKGNKTKRNKTMGKIRALIIPALTLALATLTIAVEAAEGVDVGAVAGQPMLAAIPIPIQMNKQLINHNRTKHLHKIN
jgi:hypothetical protein